MVVLWRGPGTRASGSNPKGYLDLGVGFRGKTKQSQGKLADALAWMAGPLSRPVSNRYRYRIESVRFQPKRTDAFIRVRKTHATPVVVHRVGLSGGLLLLLVLLLLLLVLLDYYSEYACHF